MKLEYIHEGSPDCPLIRLYDFDTSQAQLLRQAFEDIVSEKEKIVALHELPFIEPLGGAQVWIAEKSDIQFDDDAVTRTLEDGMLFTWMMTKEEWNDAIALLDAYTPSPDSFQWLTDDFGIQVLLSQSGTW
ncbi:MAG: hypothetical protein Q8896_06675 [Bacteroidota bacterium]|nr:hypothetical protein [Bacteroidota bacterium]MDP4237201.1 hypothetical protein [Bacteroidota bacterium]